MLATFFKVVEKTPDVLVYYWTVDRTRTYPDADEFERLVQRDGPAVLKLWNNTLAGKKEEERDLAYARPLQVLLQELNDASRGVSLAQELTVQVRSVLHPYRERLVCLGWMPNCHPLRIADAYIREPVLIEGSLNGP